MAPTGPPPHIPCAGGPAVRRPELPSYRVVSGPGELLLPALLILEPRDGPGMRALTCPAAPELGLHSPHSAAMGFAPARRSDTAVRRHDHAFRGLFVVEDT